MLSPKARNFVRERCGAADATVTVNVHELVARTASVAVQRTVVEPMGKIDVDPGEQLVWTGATPPLATAAAKVTGAPLLVSAVAF